MKRGALLLRCSTDSQDYDRQQRDLMPTAKNLGYEITDDLIFGEYVTGKDDVRKKDRESIANLKQACTDGKVDAIFINEVSRLSRDSIAGRLFIREFNDEYKVPVFFRDLQMWTIDPNTKSKNAYLEQILGFYFDAAAAELKSMKTRFASGKRKNARTGKSIGGVLSIGYTKDKDGTIIIDEENAKYVRIIFDKYLEEDGTITTVGRYLRGISNVRTWGSGTIGNILRNKAYTGKLEVSITNPDEIDENKKIDKILIDIPKIIDEETFNKVQGKLDSNRSTQEYTRKKIHILQKLIICSDCGKAFSAKSGNAGKNHTYCCVSKQNGINCNMSVALDADKTEAIIWNLVKNKLLELNQLGEKEKEERINKEKHQIERCEEEIEAIELGNNKIVRKKKNLIDYLEEAESDEEIADIKARRKKYDNEIAENKNRINLLKEKIEICKSNINRHLNSKLTGSILSSIESDRNKMKVQIKEFIKSIVPYPIANSHSVLDVRTTFGNYYILYSSRDKYKQAYYLYGGYYKYFPKEKKFLVLGGMDEEVIEQLEGLSRISIKIEINPEEKTNYHLGDMDEEIIEQSEVFDHHLNLSEAVQKNKFYYMPTNNKASLPVFTFDEMKEKCKKMNWILPFSI